VNGAGVNGCINTSTITQTTSPCTGISNSYFENEILKAYPNPFSNELVFSINNFNEEVNVKIYNTIGQMVFQTNLTQADTSIDMQHLSAGIYFAHVQAHSVAPIIIRLIKE
ncbi:MAG: T9SS type A sorting domain-containing protein, partial [Bacteroidia bacterium]